MPVNSPKTPRDRAEGQNVNTHPRANGDLILTPDDIFEGQGNFTFVDEEGNPEGFRLGQPPERDGWHVYEGEDPEKTTRQTTAPLPVDRPSFLFSQPSVRGHAPPTKQIAAKVPRPSAPRVTKEKAERAGYPASTPERPFFFAWTIAERIGNRFVHTQLSPFTACEPNGNGQGFRIPLPPREMGEFAGLWLTEPGTSSADRAGPVREQGVVRIRDFASGYYDLSGPYRYNARLTPSRNETELAAPGQARFRFEKEQAACRPGIFRCAASFATERGEGPMGPYSGPLTIASSDYYREDENEENPPGYGRFRVYRPTTQRGAAGWYAYVETSGQVYRVYNKTTGQGLTKPLPLSWTYIESAGWEGSEKYGQNDTNLLASASLTEENTSGLSAPDSAPETPTAFGAVLPEPGRRFLRVTDTYRGKQSLPSESVRVDLGVGQVMRVVYRSPVNAIPNASYVETDPDDLPFDHVINAPSDSSGRSAARVVSGEMVMEVLPGQENAEYEERTAFVEVDTSEEWSVGSEFAVEQPETGEMGGVFESVLVEEDEAGEVLAETVLYSTGEAGEHEYYVELPPSEEMQAAAFPGFSWNPQTFAVRLVHRILGGTKNMRTRMRRKQLKDHPGRPRPAKPAKPDKPRRPPKPDPEAPLPGGGHTVVTPPPAPPDPPAPPQAEIRPVNEPDRPRSEGEILEDLEGFLNGIPAGWQADASAGATVEASPSAAISGTMGLLLKDTGTTEEARANISKVSEARHDGGVFSRNRMADMPISGTVEMHPLSAPDGTNFAWLELGTEAEKSRLTVTEGPKLPGSIGVVVDGAKQEVAVEAVREAARLDLASPPTSYGDVSVNLGTPDGGGVATAIPTGGQEQVVELTVQTPRHNGRVTVTLDGVSQNVIVHRTHSADEVAARIRRKDFPGWRISGRRNQIVYEATEPGPKGACSYSRADSGTPGAMTISVPGANETTEELASRIRATRFPGWKTSGAGTSVEFAAVYAGAREDASFDPGETGVVGAMTTATQGSADTPDSLAAKIRTLSFIGWTAGGSGADVTFDATTQGFRRDLRFAPGETLARAAATTLAQGKDADLFAIVKGEDGNERRRKIMSALLETDVWQTDLTISGAGTDEAIISVWGAIEDERGADTPKELIARFEEVNLEGLLFGKKTLGITSESRPETTFELHVDEALITDRGLVYHRDHDHAGNLIGQLHGYFVPGQPERDDLLLQGPEGEDDGKRIAVLPNREYAFGAFLRHRGIKKEAKPLDLTALLSDGSAKALGCITGGVVGTEGWREEIRRITTPSDCHEIRLRSRDVGAGEIVIQELAPSLGAEVRRTGLYATSGSHTATLLIGTKRRPPNVFVGRKRLSLEIDTEEPEGATVDALYRAGRTIAGPWSEWIEFADNVPQLEVPEIHVEMTGGGLVTPVLRSGFPRAEYDLVLGLRPIATLLTEDRSELPGGAFFGELEEWTNRTKVGVRELPSGRLQRRALFDPTGHFPASVIYVFTPEARNYLEEKWGLETFCIEAREWGEMGWIKPSGQLDFESSGHAWTPEGRFAFYAAAMAACEVTERRPLL